MRRILSLSLAGVLALSLLAGCRGESEPTPEAGGLYTAGEYTATAQGNNGPVTVKVRFEADKIADVTVTDQAETAGIADPALERIPGAIVEHQSLGVDAVAGATVTSNAILAAVADAVKQAGGDPEALKTPVEQAPAVKTERSESADVVVVGSGISGLSAALAAAEGGAKVVVLEKMTATGGTTALAGGFLICIDPEKTTNPEVDATLATFRTYWEERMAVSGQESGYPDYDRWEHVVSRTGTTVDWLADNGINWGNGLGNFFGPYPVVMNPAGGRGLVDEMVAAAKAKGVEVITECTAKTLTTDAAGAVTGLVAETNTEIITYTAKAVILCTGGSSADEEITRQYSPKVAQAGTVSTAAAGSTGDGQRMAQAVGAKVFDRFFTSIWATAVAPDVTAAVYEATDLTTVNQLGVNAKGQRFASEVARQVDALGSDMIQDGNAPFWYIYDSANENVATFLERCAQAGVIAKGETIEELAQAMDVPADALRQTYDRYCQLVEDGADPDFHKPAENLVALDTAPFYAVRFCPTTFGSQGGVETDYDGRVLNAAGEAIPGLYAAGEMSNRYYYNENYVLAASLGLYATAGRMAGTAAAADVK